MNEEVEAVAEEVTAEVVAMAEVAVTVAIEVVEAVAEEVTAEEAEVVEAVLEEVTAEVDEVVTEVVHPAIEAGNYLVTRSHTHYSL